MIRPLNSNSPDEIELVATRMRLTLIDVLGESRGVAMYSLDWLRDRVLFHLDKDRSNGIVFLKLEADQSISGHAIARVERDDEGTPFGLFSTIYVEPHYRKRGRASELVHAVQDWFADRSIRQIAYNTATSNTKTIQLFQKHGYVIALEHADMVRMEKGKDKCAEKKT